MLFHLSEQNFEPMNQWGSDKQGCTLLGFKLKKKNDNDNDKKNWRNRLFAISPIFVVQFSPNF